MIKSPTQVVSEAYTGARSPETDPRNLKGCLRHCNGIPIRVGSAEYRMWDDTIAVDSADEEAVEELVDRARAVGEALGALEEVCVDNCPGAYTLFEGDEELMVGDDEVVVKRCLIPDLLERAAEGMSLTQPTGS